MSLNSQTMYMYPYTDTDFILNIWSMKYGNRQMITIAMSLSVLSSPCSCFDFYPAAVLHGFKQTYIAEFLPVRINVIFPMCAVMFPCSPADDLHTLHITACTSGHFLPVMCDLIALSIRKDIFPFIIEHFRDSVAIIQGNST